MLFVLLVLLVFVVVVGLTVVTADVEGDPKISANGSSSSCFDSFLGSSADTAILLLLSSLGLVATGGTTPNTSPNGSNTLPLSVDLVGDTSNESSSKENKVVVSFAVGIGGTTLVIPSASCDPSFPDVTTAVGLDRKSSKASSSIPDTWV